MIHNLLLAIIITNILCLLYLLFTGLRKFFSRESQIFDKN
jgi:hypothetical protein